MVAAGDRIYASDFNNLPPKTYTKAALQARVSTTVVADDAELAGIPLAVGTYHILLTGFFSVFTTTTQKLKTQWGFTGTWNNPARACIGPAQANVAGGNAVTVMNTAGVATNGDAVYSVVNAVAYSVFQEEAFNVVVTVAGNLSLKWAQFASSANATNVADGTTFMVRKVA
jgi:hypothetical protein